MSAPSLKTVVNTFAPRLLHMACACPRNPLFAGRAVHLPFIFDPTPPGHHPRSEWIACRLRRTSTFAGAFAEMRIQIGQLIPEEAKPGDRSRAPSRPPLPVAKMFAAHHAGRPLAIHRVFILCA